MFFALIRTVFPERVTFAPRCWMIFSITSASLMAGTSCMTISSFVRMEAAIIGRTAFLFPPTVTFPEISAPPLMTRLRMSLILSSGSGEGAVRISFPDIPLQ